MKILVTGGLGFIGSQTVVELTKAGYTPIIIDNLSNSSKGVLNGITQILGKAPDFYESDYANKAVLSKIFKNEQVGGVIHFAAHKAVNDSLKQPLNYYQNNVGGLLTLLGTMRKHNVGVLVFSSSCTVYGEPDTLPITETSPIKPATSPYGTTKQMCETIIKDITTASTNLKSISLRYFNPIGADPTGYIGELPLGVPANLVPYITQAAAGLRPSLTVYGNDYPTPDGTCIRDFIHVIDLAKAHIKALEFLNGKKPRYYDVFNIGTGKGHSVLETIKTFEKTTGKKVPYNFGQKRQGDIIKIYADAKKAENILGWKATKSLSQALADAWRWQNSLTK